MNVDFVDRIPTNNVVGANTAVIRWDAFRWDEAQWPAERVLSNPWVSLAGTKPGYAGSVRMRAVVVGTGAPITLEMNAFNVIFEVGEPLG